MVPVYQTALVRSVEMTVAVEIAAPATRERNVRKGSVRVSRVATKSSVERMAAEVPVANVRILKPATILLACATFYNVTAPVAPKMKFATKMLAVYQIATEKTAEQTAVEDLVESARRARTAMVLNVNVLSNPVQKTAVMRETCAMRIHVVPPIVKGRNVEATVVEDFAANARTRPSALRANVHVTSFHAERAAAEQTKFVTWISAAQFPAMAKCAATTGVEGPVVIAPNCRAPSVM